MGQKSHFYAFYTASLFLWLAGGPCAQASNYFTRFTVGSYLSDENFSNAVDGTTRNSFSTVSSRAYFRVSELDNKNIEVIGDIRDTHDFFEKLDTERLELTAQNNLQVKQLSIKDTELTQNTFVQLGRLPVFEAGAISVDGALLGYHLDHISSLALFGGLNPQRIDQKSAQWNPDSQNFGLYYRYQPQYDSWYDSLVGNMAVVVQRVQNHNDRLVEERLSRTKLPQFFAGKKFHRYRPHRHPENEQVDIDQRGHDGGGYLVMDIAEGNQRQQRPDEETYRDHPNRLQPVNHRADRITQ